MKRQVKQKIKSFGWAFNTIIILLSSSLLIINFIGLFNNPYNVENLQYRIEDTTISYDQALVDLAALDEKYRFKLDKLSYEDEINVIERVVNIVFERMSNLPGQKYCGKNLYRISIFDNWLLFIKSTLIVPDYRHEFANPYRALRTGAGFCSQQSIAAAELLLERGFKAGIQGLRGHVVAWVATQKGIHVIDPDYGVILPYDFHFLFNNKKIIIEYYMKMKLKMPSKEDLYNTVEMIADTYVKNVNRNIYYVEGVDGYKGSGDKNYEDKLYYFKWEIPIFLLLISLINYLIFKKKSVRKE